VRFAIAVAAAALGVLQAQPSRPFSHRLHLKLKLECTGCHAAAAKSTRAEDNLLPQKTVCLGCHKEVTIPPPPATPVRFNHAQHLRLGNIAPILARAIEAKTYLSPPGDTGAHLHGTNPCAACHRGLEESDKVTSAALPRMADCLVCHAQVDPPDSCELCHAKGMKLKPANHTPDFLDSHSRKSTVLDKPSCAVCHGRKFTCLGCH
jgi:predicted CXXCH cytochrome family protein